MSNNLIVNADDFGYSKEVNQGIILAFDRGLITQTTLMVNMPYVDDALAHIPESLRDKIGLHLNLQEGKPLTAEMSDCKSFCDNAGMFKFSTISVCRQRILTKEERIILSREIEAQIEKYRSYNLPMWHIDSHQHVHNEYQILELLLPLAKDFKSMRICRNLFSKKGFASQIKAVYKRIINRKIKSQYNHSEWFGSYNDYRNYYKSGSVEIMCHPSLANGEVVDIIDRNNNIFKPMNEYTYM